MRDYITKLNDRNLQRKKATGFTNYVLYSLIIIIAFKIFDLVGRINFQELETYEFTKLTWYSFCLSLALYFTYYSFVTSFNNTSTVRILKKSRKKETYFLNIIISGFFQFNTKSRHLICCVTQTVYQSLQNTSRIIW